MGKSPRNDCHWGGGGGLLGKCEGPVFLTGSSPIASGGGDGIRQKRKSNQKKKVIGGKTLKRQQKGVIS